METGCIGKSNTNNLPVPTDLTENPYRKKKIVFKDATQKSASMVQWGIAIEFVPWRPIFEKCSHLREKGGVLTKIWLIGNSLCRTDRMAAWYCIYGQDKITDVGTFSFR
jgi:hypothetical protein